MINNTNSGVINAFTIQDGHLHVHRRILNDLAKDLLKDGCEGTLQVLADGCIDWEWYFREYERTKVAIALAVWFRKMTEQQEIKEESPDEDADMVFGGNYANPYSAEG